MNDQNRSNALLVTWDGTGRYAGDVYANYNFATNTGEKLATEAYVEEHGGGDMSAYATKEELNTKANKSDLNSYATTTALNKKADKDNTVLGSTLSGGRRSGSSVGTRSIAFGTDVVASGRFSFGFGESCEATGEDSVALGYYSKASGEMSYAEGSRSVASGKYSHAETGGTASGMQSHAESGGTASGTSSHAESGGHAEGTDSHAEGGWVYAKGIGSHAEGYSTIANGDHQHVSGVCNIEDTVPQTVWVEGTAYSKNDIVKYTSGSHYICIVDTSSTTWKPSEWRILRHTGEYAVIVGNGSDDTRSNAAAIGWDGTGKYAGDVYANYDFATKTGEKLATESFVRELIQQYLGS